MGRTGKEEGHQLATATEHGINPGIRGLDVLPVTVPLAMLDLQLSVDP